MHRFFAALTSALILSGCSILGSATQPANAPVVPALPSNGMKIGAYVDPAGKQGEAAVTAFETSLGEKLAIDNHYSSFGWSNLAIEPWDIAGGRIPMLSWSAGDGNGGCALYSDIVAGKYDTQLASQASAVKALTGTIWLRLFYEMTDSPSETCANPTKSGPLFIQAWQHVVGVFRAAGVTNAKWVWAPGEPAYFGNIELNFYPGSPWVDIVGEDMYNKTPNAEPFLDGMTSNVCSVAAQLGKPSAITETGAGGTANQIAWLAGVKTACPGLGYLIYWDASGVQPYPITDPSVFAALKALGQ